MGNVVCYWQLDAFISPPRLLRFESFHTEIKSPDIHLCLCEFEAFFKSLRRNQSFVSSSQTSFFESLRPLMLVNDTSAVLFELKIPFMHLNWSFVSASHVKVWVWLEQLRNAAVSLHAAAADVLEASCRDSLSLIMRAVLVCSWRPGVVTPPGEAGRLLLLLLWWSLLWNLLLNL